jgi:predicted RND superfamily exporter protein
MDYQRLVDWVDSRIVGSPGKVMLAFLLVTLVFAGGLGNVSTESGTQQFAEDIPANNALEDINREFGPSFSADTGSTQLIQRADNVLAKKELIRMLEAQKRVADQEELRVTGTSSAAQVVAREIDPQATTLDQQQDALEGATQREVAAAVRANADNPALTGTVSNDFNGRSASASATIGVIQHTLPSGLSGGGAGMGGSSPLTDIQLRIDRITDTVGGDITVFGSGLIADEFSTVITDSLLIVTPAAVLFIIFFLVVAYRDLVDLLLGTVSLGMATIWTFGFLGLVGIPFNQIMISVPPLLLAVGIDFGIHAINRYREDRETGLGIDDAMTQTTDQLLVAFFIVTGTTVIGFLANLVSDLPPIRDFGLVAAAGIVFTFLIFGVFLPSAKVWVDRNRERFPIPTFSQRPLGAEGSSVGRLLQGGVVVADKIPVGFLLLALLLSAGAGYYATGVDTTFTQEDFLPPEEVPSYLQALPEPFAPGDYTVVSTLNFLEDKFQTTQGGSVTIYVERPMQQDSVLEEIHRMGDSPPDSFVEEDGRAQSQSIVTVIQSQAARDPEFRQVVARNDRDGNGIPDRNLETVYDELLQTEARGQALQYLAEDRQSTRVVYSVSADASQDEIVADGKTVADRFRGAAIATGGTVVFAAVSDVIFESAILSLALALTGTAVFLLFIYWVLEGLPSLGIANLVPIVVAVSLVAGSMRVLGIAFNAFTATILALTIGLGIDYSVHVVHRFVDERHERPLVEALRVTVRGTGGALLGSMLTTSFGIGVLVLAVLSVLGQFGTLTALSIVYSFFASLLVLPSALVIWDRLVGNDPDRPMGSGEPSPDDDAGRGATLGPTPAAEPRTDGGTPATSERGGGR